MKTLGNGSELNILMEAVLVNYGIDMTDLDTVAEELPGADVRFVLFLSTKKTKNFSGKCPKMK